MNALEFSPSTRVKGLLIAAVLALGVLGTGRGLWTPDEPREAEISREMALAPSSVPTLDGEPYLEKPPLYYWVQAVVIRVTGEVSPRAVRIVSVVCGWLTLLVVGVWGARAISSAAGWVAVGMFATSYEVVTSTHWVGIDALLMLLVTVSLWLCWERWLNQGPGWLLVPMYGSACLALLSKGAIGPLMIVIAVALYWWLGKLRTLNRALKPVWGAVALSLTAGLVALLWWRALGTSAVSEWLWTNHVQRFLDPASTGHRQHFYYYLPALPLAISPWLVSIPNLWRARFWNSETASSAHATKLFWVSIVLGPLLLLSIAATKRQTYLLPLLPALVLLLAAAEVHAWQEATRAARSWGRALRLLWFGLWACLPAVVLMTYDRQLQTLPMLSVLVVAVLCWYALVRGNQWSRPRTWALECGLAGLAVFVGLVLCVPRIDAIKNMGPFLTWVDQAIPVDDAVSVVGPDETLRGIVPFVTGRPVVDWSSRFATMTNPQNDPFPAYVLAQEKDRRALPAALRNHYEQLRIAEFGSDRRLSLWHLTSDPRSGSEAIDRLDRGHL